MVPLEWLRQESETTRTRLAKCLLAASRVDQHGAMLEFYCRSSVTTRVDGGAYWQPAAGGPSRRGGRTPRDRCRLAPAARLSFLLQPPLHPYRIAKPTEGRGVAADLGAADETVTGGSLARTRRLVCVRLPWTKTRWAASAEGKASSSVSSSGAGKLMPPARWMTEVDNGHRWRSIEF